MLTASATVWLGPCLILSPAAVRFEGKKVLLRMNICLRPSSLNGLAFINTLNVFASER